MLSFILFIIIIAVLALFAGFNLGNTCNINILFHTFEKVPVFVTIIISFVAGAIVTFPVMLFRKPLFSKKKNKKDKGAVSENTNGVTNEKNKR